MQIDCGVEWRSVQEYGDPASRGDPASLHVASALARLLLCTDSYVQVPFPLLLSCSSSTPLCVHGCPLLC
jgi:hypothetical protein